jgi:glyceraldehyde-3-phosphate dehydrogenase/erythrose-4-phosphate dehydrogenase
MFCSFAREIQRVPSWLRRGATMVDAPHKDLRRARSGLMSLIPMTTGSATAITLIYPELKGKLNGVA